MLGNLLHLGGHLDRSTHLLEESEADAAGNRGPPVPCLGGQYPLIVFAFASRTRSASLTRHLSQTAFYGFIVSLYMATYLGGIGYHMSQLNKFHIARLTQVRTHHFPEFQILASLLILFAQSFLVIQSLYGLSMCTIKWSMLFMLKRIFAVRYFRV